MPYLNSAFIKFFQTLTENNSTEWFNENRKTYEKEVKKPFADLVAEMIRRIQEYEPDVQIKPADAISRINKDIRFSKDKTPYNTHVAANISKFGKKDKSYPGIYFQVAPTGISVFGGAYMIENPVLQDIRSYISGNLEEFQAVYNDKDFKAKFGSLQGEQNKRVPAEFQEAALKEPLIANKQFYFSATLDPNVLTSEELPDKLMEYYLAGRKVNEFLKEAIRK